ncbi:hypothetical protein LIA77_04667 [Sarocladium implicatum]|nr:hypothetical protein LIA77_04667 [Sarocladium implicatum]
MHPYDTNAQGAPSNGPLCPISSTRRQKEHSERREANVFDRFPRRYSASSDDKSVSSKEVTAESMPRGIGWPSFRERHDVVPCDAGRQKRPWLFMMQISHARFPISMYDVCWGKLAADRATPFRLCRAPATP